MNYLNYYINQEVKVHRLKMAFFLIFISSITLIPGSFVLAEESISITTYYPSPYGVYNEMRLFPHSTPLITCDATTEGTMFFNSTSQELQVCKGIAGWGGTSAFWASSGDDIYNTNTNNVGIGTNAPGAKLEVNGDVLFNGTIEGNTSGITIPNSDIILGGGIDGYFALRSKNVGARKVVFGSENACCGANPWTMAVDNQNSTVGIGTTRPENHLHILGNRQMAEITLQSDNNPGNYSDIHFDNTESGGREYVVGNYGAASGATANKFYIIDKTAGANRFIIDNNGYVGIGTTSPRATLDVIGDEIIVEDGSPEINFVDSDPGDINWRIGGGTAAYSYLTIRPTTEANIDVYLHSGMMFKYMSGVNLTYVGIGINPTRLLDLNGGAYCTGTGAWVDGSDKAYKKDIDYNFQYGLQTIEQLKPVYYVHKEDIMNKKQIGFIAQDVKEVIPEVVDGEEGTYGLAYGRFAPVLVNAIKEQQKQIEVGKAQTIEQQKQLEDLQAQIMGLKRK